MIGLFQTIALTTLMQVSAPLFAQAPASPVLPSDITAVSQSLPASDVTELDTARQQIELLQAQLQMTRDYQGSILDTVYWALGGVFIVVSLLLGFGWFVNFKVYERDKDSLRSELEATARAKATELDRSVAEQMTAVSDSLPKQIEESIAGSLKPTRRR